MRFYEFGKFSRWLFLILSVFQQLFQIFQYRKGILFLQFLYDKNNFFLFIPYSI